jgi:small subunit ribosomal protein S6
VKKYEGLFILETAGKEDAEKEIIDRIQKAIEQAGGSVETVQKMGVKPFARTTEKHAAGNYVNVIFHAPPKAITALDTKFNLDADVFRWQFTEPMPEMPERKPRTTTETAESPTRRI